MRIALQNKTHWRDDHIRAFLRRGIREERPDLCKRGASAMAVEIVYTRSHGNAGSSGLGAIRRNWIRIRLPKNIAPDRIDFAHVIAHELAHTRGMSDEYMMRHSARYGRIGSWRSIYAWAEALPLDRREDGRRSRPAASSKLAHVQSMLAKARTRERRAVTIRRKWERRMALYSRRIDAIDRRDSIAALAAARLA